MNFLLFFVVHFFTSIYVHSLPVFPGAQGYGTDTTGGSGRHLSSPNTTILIISTLNKDGKGSIQECIDFNGPRICIFEVSGVIINTDPGKYTISNPYITIAGQTSKYGIILRGCKIEILCSDVLIQHIIIEQHDDLIGGVGAQGRDCIGINGNGQKGIVIDHVSGSFAIDEIMDVYGSTNYVTFSYNILSLSLYDSIHPKGLHSKGLLVGPGNNYITVHHNIFAHHDQRQPRFSGGPGAKPANYFEIINNVIYNNGRIPTMIACDGGIGEGQKGLIIGNYWKAGADTMDKHDLEFGDLLPSSLYYVFDNVGQNKPEGSNNDDWDICASKFGTDLNPYKANDYVFQTSMNSIDSPIQAKTNVFNNAGARPKQRRDFDLQLFVDFENGDGKIINCVNAGTSPCDRNAGGFSTLSNSNDKLNVPHYYWIKEKNGYLRIENWLHTFYYNVENIEESDNCNPQCGENEICINRFCVNVNNGVAIGEGNWKQILIATTIGVSSLIVLFVVIIIILVLFLLYKKLKGGKKEKLLNVNSTTEEVGSYIEIEEEMKSKSDI